MVMDNYMKPEEGGEVTFTRTGGLAGQDGSVTATLLKDGNLQVPGEPIRSFDAAALAFVRIHFPEAKSTDPWKLATYRDKYVSTP
jgi:hypothetical protein